MNWICIERLGAGFTYRTSCENGWAPNNPDSVIPHQSYKSMALTAVICTGLGYRLCCSGPARRRIHRSITKLGLPCYPNVTIPH